MRLGITVLAVALTAALGAACRPAADVTMRLVVERRGDESADRVHRALERVSIKVVQSAAGGGIEVWEIPAAAEATVRALVQSERLGVNISLASAVPLFDALGAAPSIESARLSVLGAAASPDTRQRISISAARIRALARDAQLGWALSLPGQEGVVRLDRVSLRGDVLEARVVSGGQVLLSLDGDRILGAIDLPRRAYAIVPGGSIASALEGQHLLYQEAGPLGLDDTSVLTEKESWPPQQGIGDCVKGEITVTVASTPAVRTVYFPQQLTIAAASLLKDALQESGLGQFRFTMASMEVGEDETGLAETDLVALATANASGKWAALRSVKTDLVVLLVKTAFQDGLDLGGLATVAASTSNRFAVVRASAIAHHSLSHEIGHLAGARHQLALDSTAWPFPHGHGFVGSTFATIMAAPDGGHPRAPVFSNPAKQRDGFATGDVNANVAGAFGSSLPYLSSLVCEPGS